MTVNELVTRVLFPLGIQSGCLAAQTKNFIGCPSAVRTETFSGNLGLYLDWNFRGWTSSFGLTDQNFRKDIGLSGLKLPRQKFQ